MSRGWRDVIEQTSQSVDTVTSFVIGVCVASFTAITVVQVFCRYILGFSLFWSDELATVLFAWVTFLGAGSAMRRRELVGVDFITKTLPGRLRNLVAAAQQLLIVAFLAIVLVYGVELMRGSAEVESPTLQISMAWPYLSVVVGAAVMILHALVALARSVEAALHAGREEP